MNYEQFIESLNESEEKIFHCGLVYKSNSVPMIVRKIAGMVYFNEIMPAGIIFESLNLQELEQLANMTGLFFNQKEPENEIENEILVKNTFNLVTLVQVFLAGEGDLEIRNDREELFHLIAILANLTHVEMAAKNGLIIPMRKNYSFNNIDRTLFMKRTK